MTPEFQTVLDRLDELAAADPRLEQYRTQRSPKALFRLPQGWHLSQDMVALITEGAWWPGLFYDEHLAEQDDFMDPASALEYGAEPSVAWFRVGSVYEKDFCLTPALRSPEPCAPVLMWCEGWTSMVFPTEASLLEAFAITYETCGMDESVPDYPSVTPTFVEWVLDPPKRFVTDERLETHRRIAERSTAWETSHPTWHHETMPFLSTGVLDVRAEAALFGVAPEQVRRDPLADPTG